MKAPKKAALPAALSSVALLALGGALVPSAIEAAGKRATPSEVRVELGLTAREAQWRPGRSGTGSLTLEGVAPRMTVMAVAPRKELVDVPASTLANNWRRLAGRDGRANAMLSATINGRAQLYAVQLKLARHRPSGSEMRFKVTPLRHRGHHPARLGGRPRMIEDPTLVVDPVIDSTVKALWAWLQSLFADDPAPSTPAPDPVTIATPTEPPTFSTAGDTYAGTDGIDISTLEGRVEAQTANLNAVEATYGELGDPERPADVTFDAGSVSGAALFNDSFGDVSFEGPAFGSQTVRNLALYDIRANSLSVTNADVGGANLRASGFGSVNISNAAFDEVDLTGAALGDRGSPDAPRSTVTNSVFMDVVSTRASGSDEGQDAVDPARALVQFGAVDFTSVSFMDVDFGGALLSSVTFQGCGLQNVDLTGATIAGDPGPTTTDDAGNVFDTFQPSFENSILENVTLDGATLTRVSFAGVDFSQGVSLDGATLSNVDFTGASGLQSVDWSKVRIAGPVYGLGEYAQLVGTVDDPGYLRSFTTDGAIPELDPQTGFDLEFGTGYLIDPGSGVRLERASGGGLVPIDPRTGEPMQDPETGSDIEYTGGELLDPASGRIVPVDYFTGIPEFD